MLSLIIYFFILFLLFIVVCVVFVLLYFEWSFTYWQRKGLEYLAPTLPFGSLGNIIDRKEHMDTKVRGVYNNFKKRGLKHGGYYVLKTALYMPVDPEYIKNVLVKDFDHFANRNLYYNERDDPLSGHLANLRGLKWKTLRAKISPTFTSGKIKIMFETFLKCCDELLKVLQDITEHDQPLEIKETVACFTTDVICSCAFGIECNTLKDPNSDFRKYAKAIFSASKTKLAKLLLCSRFPKLGRLLGIGLTDKNVANFFTRVITANAEHRLKHNIYRKDFLQLMLDTRITTKDESVSLSMNEILAQCYIFYAAGLETSSTTMSFCLFEIASNPDVQKSIREEIVSVLTKYDGKICYDAVMEMSYLNKVVLETLRKHPAIAQIVRRCTKTYKVPGSNVVIEKGTDVVISILGIHFDPDYYPNPEKFDPERFSNENIARRPPCTFLTFGDGPRNCLGLRFALLQIKVGVIGFVKNYRLSVNSKTKLPLQRDKKAVFYAAQGGMWLNLTKI